MRELLRFEGGWDIQRLGTLGPFRKGRGIKRSDLRARGAPCIRYGELYTRYRNYVAEPVSRIPESVAASSLPIEAGELLFAGSGETPEEIGVCVAYIGDRPAYAGGDLIILRASGEDPVFLAHLLNAPGAAQQKSRLAQGDAVVHIRASHLAEILLPLPTLAEQRAIAAVLTDVDDLIEALEALVAKKRAIKTATMQQLLSGRTRLPGFGGEWEVGRLRDVVRLHREQVLPDADTVYDHYSLPAYDAGKQAVSEPGLDIRSVKFHVPAGSVLLSRLNPRISRVWTPDNLGGNAVASTEFLVLAPRDAGDREYIHSLCSSRPFRERMVGTVTGSTGSHQRVNRFDVMNLRIRFPKSLPEQRAIAAVLTDMDAEITALERRLDKTRDLKRGMMQQLLTGAIRLPIPEDAAEHEATP